jgi:pimeloyl-ACP methyl ester carboxylesterase
MHERIDLDLAPGVRLAVERRGEASRTVLLGHGGGQTRHAWERTAVTLARRGWRSVTYDLRGHGDSDWHPEGDYRIDALADDVTDVATRCAPGRAVAVGASVSGIASLLAVARHGSMRFAGLVLVDVAPTLDLGSIDRILGFMTAQLDEGFGSIDEAADAIAAYLPHRARPTDLSGLARNLRQGADGRWRWHWDPAFVRGPQWAAVESHRERLLDAARRVTVPTLLIRGRRSALVSDAAVEEFLANVPQARFVDVAGADHMVVGDRNEVFDVRLLEFLDTLEP